MKAELYLHPAYRVGEVDPRIFGSFVEHLGRVVYGGLYEPEHPTADEEGFRQDVLELVKQLGTTVVRYPGGNFVSGYRWEDGTGPKDRRPVRPDVAWKVLETNQVGVDEFQSWCKKIGAGIMMAVNLGTRGPDEARDLLEYCNFPRGTYYSDLRRANGFEEPFNIKLWCLGNEMDGSWQIGTKTAQEYGRLATETAKLMKRQDPDIELAICGTSLMDAHGPWDAEILSHAYNEVDYISLHYYYDPAQPLPEYLASPLVMDKHIKDICAVADHIKQVKHSKKTMYLSFDEWNVWNHTGKRKPYEKWSIAPHSHEDDYTHLDALVLGGLLITLLKNCDRVKIACLAQLINAIAPIRTENANEGGRSWVQTTFYPFMHASRYGRGTVLDTRMDCPFYATERFEQVPWLESCAVLSEDGGTVTVFAVNRSMEEDIAFVCDLSAFGAVCVKEQIVMNSDDVMAINTADAPHAVAPHNGGDAAVKNGVLHATLEKHSWNVIRIRL